MTKTIKDGGPAFPGVSADGRDENVGMTLRDYFAAKALPTALRFYKDGYCGNEGSLDDHASGVVAAVAYELADAMIAAREPQ